MKPSKYNLFFNVTSALLALTGIAKIWALVGHAKILEMHDPLLHLGYRPLLILVVLVELLMAAFLVKSTSDLSRGMALMWLSSNFLFYHLGNYFLNLHLCPCLGAISDNLPLPKGMGEVIVKVLAFYWFLASVNLLWKEWWSAEWDRAVSAVTRIILRAPATAQVTHDASMR